MLIAVVTPNRVKYFTLQSFYDNYPSIFTMVRTNSLKGIRSFDIRTGINIQLLSKRKV